MSKSGVSSAAPVSGMVAAVLREGGWVDYPWWGRLYSNPNGTYTLWAEKPNSDSWNDMFSTVFTVDQVICQVMVLAVEDEDYFSQDDALNKRISDLDMDTVMQTLVYGDLAW